ncbi:D-arabinose 1-dehydrogenase (NAD(P)(+)) [Asimina triloba]
MSIHLEENHVSDGEARKPLVFAYYVTGHGFGHATRVVEVVRHLIAAGNFVHVVTGAPDFVFTTEIQSPNLIIRKVLLDCGAVQADALTVDRLASLEKYSQTAVVPRASILATEVEWLTSIKAELVVSDVVPVACRAAADAGIRSVCVTNFSWDFIYAEYVMAAGCHHRSIVWQIADDYSHCEVLLRLPGYCPMPAFRDVIDVPLVVRRLHKSRAEVRKELGVGDDVKLVLFNFGGQQAGWNVKQEWLPDGWICLVCGASDNQELPPNFVKLAKDVYTPDLIAACDCMLGKIGYGTCSESLAYKLPFVFVRRDYFNEEPFLRNMLEHYQCGVEMIRRDLLTGHWKPYLERALSLKPCYEGGINGGEVAARILQDTAVGKNFATNKLSGVRRLRDAIVLGYQLQRAPGRDLSIPEWFSLAENEVGIRPTMPREEMNEKISLLEPKIDDFEILHGELHGLPDTVAFLNSLAGLASGNDSGKNAEKRQLRERIAAAALFNWEEAIFIARAPGRLDVMGGIADYSGSLVLQMPIREACHAAVQRNHPSKQRLWKHALARQQAKGRGPIPVSFGSELSNRAPTFDIDLADLMEDGQPLSYEKARKYFAQDPSQKFVSSAVPEGKGVSSSASLEVATMSAIAAAHVYGIKHQPKRSCIALPEGMVENHVVGAPCGVMDQMTSACGEANKLLAMVCQPAEVKELVNIPTHIRFWGIDSGIRHSVGGADYGSVRVGAFMGRKMLRSMASELLSVSQENHQPADGLNGGYEYEDNDVELLETEASLDYLCNLSPHRYEGVYAKKLPDLMLGETFLEKYVDHSDSVTVIDSKCTYHLKAPARHPIYENFRVKAFKVLLTAESTDEQLSALGELMYQNHRETQCDAITLPAVPHPASNNICFPVCGAEDDATCHYSYGDCGLGSDGTDRLIKLVQEMQHRKPSHGKDGTLFGAKITGGGSGGSVCVMGRNCARSSQEIFEIQERYKDATGYLPYIFEGSSPGAGTFGYLKIRQRVKPIGRISPQKEKPPSFKIPFLSHENIVDDEPEMEVASPHPTCALVPKWPFRDKATEGGDCVVGIGIAFELHCMPIVSKPIIAAKEQHKHQGQSAVNAVAASIPAIHCEGFSSIFCSLERSVLPFMITTRTANQTQPISVDNHFTRICGTDPPTCVLTCIWQYLIMILRGNRSPFDRLILSMSV